MDLQQLKKQIPYQWRVQSFQGDKAVCVAYIDSRDVQEMLDNVCGPESWQCDYKEIKGNLFCGIGIAQLVGKDLIWVWKWDCGTESNTDKEKGEASDSFKRAAVKWGIGRFLYDLEIVKVGTAIYEKNGKQYPTDNNGKILWTGAELTKFINSKNNTSSYNHKELSQNGKPLISNAQFKSLVERIRKGDYEAGAKAKEMFSFESTQEKILNDLLIAIA